MFWTEKCQVTVPSSIYITPQYRYAGCRKEVPSTEQIKEKQEQSNFVLEKLDKATQPDDQKSASTW